MPQSKLPVSALITNEDRRIYYRLLIGGASNNSIGALPNLHHFLTHPSTNVENTADDQSTVFWLLRRWTCCLRWTGGNGTNSATGLGSLTTRWDAMSNGSIFWQLGKHHRIGCNEIRVIWIVLDFIQQRLSDLLPAHDEIDVALHVYAILTNDYHIYVFG